MRLIDADALKDSLMTGLAPGRSLASNTDVIVRTNWVVFNLDDMLELIGTKRGLLINLSNEERSYRMSLYNALMGYNPSCILFLPMLGRRSNEYPRFRDCFLTDDGERIIIYTRVGGNNRHCGYGEECLYDDPNFVCTYDDDFDETYGNYEFNVPEKWKDDFAHIKANKFAEVSDEYVKLLKTFYPQLSDDLDKIFGRKKDE